MSNVKTSVRIILALLCFYGAVHGQTLTRRQQMNLQRQQTQVDQQQELLEKQLLSQVSILNDMPSKVLLALIGSNYYRLSSHQPLESVLNRTQL